MNVLVYDNRLEGSAMPGNYVILEVGKDYHLPDLVSRLNAIAESLGKIDILQIMAHGIEEDGGGFGILLCKEKLTDNTVDMLRPLHGKVGKINMSVCSAARIETDNKLADADGKLLCKRIASITGARVKVSIYRQEYIVWSRETSRGTDFGDWEGGY